MLKVNIKTKKTKSFLFLYSIQRELFLYQIAYNNSYLFKKEGKHMKRYGYVRVSSKDQNVARQVEALLFYHIEENNIYIDRKRRSLGASFLCYNRIRIAFHTW